MYLLLIPIFALIYLSLGDQFYHSTVKYEEYLRADRDRLSEALQSAIVESFRRDHDDSWESKDGWKLKTDKMRVSELVVQNDSYSLQLFLTFENNRPTGRKIEGLPVVGGHGFGFYKITFSARAPIAQDYSGIDYLFLVCPENSAEQASLETYIPFEELFPLRRGFYTGRQNVLKAVAATFVILFSQFNIFAFDPHHIVSWHSDDDDVLSHDGSVFHIKLPSSWAADERYDFDWKLLQNQSAPFRQYAF